MPDPAQVQGARSLLPPNASATERAIEGVTARIGAVPTPHGALWDPATCPAAVLPWLAWAFSVDTWRSSWDEATKRRVIAAAFAVHRLKGTAGAVRRALEAMNARVILREWFETGGPPHTAIAEIFAWTPEGAAQLSAELLADLRAAFETSAPARAHILLIFGVVFPPAFDVAVVALRPAGRRELAFGPEREEPRLSPGAAALRPFAHAAVLLEAA